MEYSDEQIMDYVDGFLSDEEAAAVEEAIKNDPSLNEKAKKFRSSLQMATMANQLAVSKAPSFEEITERIAAKKRKESSSFLFYLTYLKNRLMVTIISVSIALVGSIGASIGFLAWRTQQVIMSFQVPAQVVVRSGTVAAEPIWYSEGPLSVYMKNNDNGKPIENGQNISVGTKISLTVKIDREKFVKAQGYWCLVINSCDRYGKISIDYRDSKGKVTKIKSNEQLSPSKSGSYYLGSVGKPLGADKVTIRLRVEDQVFSKSITYTVK